MQMSLPLHRISHTTAMNDNLEKHKLNFHTLKFANIYQKLEKLLTSLNYIYFEKETPEIY
jgi:hypothetical protein